MTSSFAPLKASKESFAHTLSVKEKPLGLALLPALLAVAVIVYFGRADSAWFAGMALAIPGVFMLFYPPRFSLGMPVHSGMLILLAGAFFAFLPVFYWPLPPWRVEAVEDLSIGLPFFLSVQPSRSWEGILMLSAGLSWFYCLAAIKLNRSGWHCFFWGLLLIMALFSSMILLGAANSWEVVAENGSTGFSFFEERAVTANFLALGGFACFAYGMRVLKKRIILTLLCLIVGLISFAALYLGSFPSGLMIFCMGVLLWIRSLLTGSRRARLANLFILTFIVSVVVWMILPADTVEKTVSFFVETLHSGVDSRVPAFLDCIHLLTESPIAGVGLGNFANVFPQYHIFSDAGNTVAYPQSDLLWFFAECGLVGVLGLIVCLVAYLRLCRVKKRRGGARIQLIFFYGALLFFLHAWVFTPAHNTGTMYFSLLFAALAVPSESLKPSSIAPKWWRLIGLFFVLNGLLWVAGDVLSLSTHSLVQNRKVALRLAQESTDDEVFWEKSLRRNPLDWQAHQERGKQALSLYGDRDAAALDFNRAAFCEPLLSIVRFEEGLFWMDHDLPRTSVAWRDALIRESQDPIAMFRRMITVSDKNPLMVDRLGHLSFMGTDFRKAYLFAMSGRSLLREIAKDFSTDPSLSNFSPADRSLVVAHWMKHADLSEVDSFMANYGSELRDGWLIEAKLLARKARFLEAVERLLENLETLPLPTVQSEERDLVLLERSYKALSGNRMRGMELLGEYLRLEESKKALDLIDSLIESGAQSRTLYYWRAMSLYHLNEYTDSWYAFEYYLKHY